MERLQKFIAEAGYCSRRKAEVLIILGKVMVNGVVINKLGTKVESSDVITIEGKKLYKEEKEHYVFNKPRGVVTTTSDDKDRKTVIDYFDSNKRLYPVGRLDYDTTGLLIVTNDGEFANMLTHPRNELEKVYVAKLEGIVNGEAIRKLKAGITLDKVKCIPDRVKLKKYDKETNSSIVEITIHDGRNHEVKKMFENVGYPVMKLKRERIEFLDLKGLLPGEYRKLTPKEIKKLYSLSN